MATLYRGCFMKIATYEATVENGQIKLSEPVRLPESAWVYVVVPGVEEARRYLVASPRLARPEQAADFVKEVTREPRDAGL
jgi:hypothetical protein